MTVPATSSSVILSVPVKLSEGTHINTEAPNSWKVCALGEEDYLDVTVTGRLP